MGDKQGFQIRGMKKSLFITHPCRSDAENAGFRSSIQPT
ncbi:Uncharacterized protein dnm_041260 [Desulfonema magnum]|uniref:Uncharacterized protein n=1 Tax=Desulfonema magnum TaxID=45655 RepID=A0A975BMC3_9BACT|nr:Uncharacterized protein dnm_041260 [Desulfonema magnum]